jgi:hypothetical protein
VTNLKRRFEEKDVEEQNKRLCEYYFLEVRADLPRRPAGIRAKIYETADHYNAVRNIKQPFLHGAKRVSSDCEPVLYYHFGCLRVHGLHD